MRRQAGRRGWKLARYTAVRGLLLLFVASGTASALSAQAAPVSPTPAAQGQVGQAPVSESGPIAVVPLNNKNPDTAAMVTGSMEVTNGKAIIAASGSVTSGSETTQVTLPHRGVLRVCASTTVKLASDSSVPAGEVPGLLMAMDHGAVEMSFADVHNSDTLMTPDFRILVGGPGAAEVKVRLGGQGDTCVDNAAVNASYVLVSSVFEGGAYRVQPGQRVMFQHGSLTAVVDQEKEPCGCPPPVRAQSNEFPLAQSEGLAPLPAPAASATGVHGAPVQTSETLTYNSAEHAPAAADAAKTDGTAAAAAAQPAAATTPVKKKKHSAFVRFFRRLFGAEE
ncbi:MAG: hypothetical protein ABR976_12190 [Terracidiphilus sp.]